jgi:hypothetical protein
MDHHQRETQERILEVEGQFADEDESIEPDVPVAVGEEITAERRGRGWQRIPMVT